jgi:methylenetetrahydrofolate reductase (NADPH)
MKKLTELFKSKPRTYSFEIYPPKSVEGYQSLLKTIEELAKLPFDFISVTYGAGGSSRDKTFDIVRLIQEKHRIPAVHHFTCVLHTRSETKKILDQLKSHDIPNILALRGDPPKEDPNWQPGEDNFKYSCELVKFIRDNYGDAFAIGVAGFPEGHPLAPSREFDTRILKKKIEAGGDFIMTQLFFDNREYFDYVKRVRALGVKVRIIPGILPITNYEGAVNFSKGCGASVPKKVHDLFRSIAQDKEKTLAVGTKFAIDQCRELLAGGAPGLHFYSLNKVEPVRTILKSI